MQLQVLPVKTMQWIAIGGLSYSIGTIWLLWDALHFNHAMWHMFVMVMFECLLCV
jgi:hemolysin III